MRFFDLFNKISYKKKCEYNLFDNINIGVAVYNVKNDGLDFVVKDFNQTAASMTNSTVSEVIGKNVLKVFPGAKEMGLLNVFYDVWKTGVSKNFSAKEYRDDKLQTFFENFVYKTLSGEIVAVFRDASLDMLLEEKMKDSEIKFRRLFEAAQDGIILLDEATGMITEVNPFLINMLGYFHQEFLGKKIWEIGLLGDVIKNKENFEELKKKGYVRFEDLPLETFDKKKKRVEFVSNVYEVDHHKIIQCNIRDITDRKIIEEKLSKIAIEKLTETEKLNHFMTDREVKMADLKKENALLKEKCKL